MSSSWNFLAQAEPSYEGSEPSRAELGHFNFRAETELNQNFLKLIFSPSFYYQKSFIMILINFMIIYLNFCVLKGEKFDFDTLRLGAQSVTL